MKQDFTGSFSKKNMKNLLKYVSGDIITQRPTDDVVKDEHGVNLNKLRQLKELSSLEKMMTSRGVKYSYALSTFEGSQQSNQMPPTEMARPSLTNLHSSLCKDDGLQTHVAVRTYKFSKTQSVDLVPFK